MSPEPRSLREFTEGLLGIPEDSLEISPQTIELRAEFASATLSKPLQIEQMEELFQGLACLLHDQYPCAAPILGKYAMLGDVQAQGAIGSMFYFGKGLPLDREEGIRWLKLAARQGGLAEKQALASAISGTWQWDDSGAEPAMAYAPSSPQAPQYAPTLPERTRSRNGPGYEASIAYGTGGAISPTAPMGARASVEQAYGYGSANRRYSDTLGTAPQTGAGSPVILNRAGAGAYSDERGDIYTQAGPHGVVNTRTGEFSPTN